MTHDEVTGSHMSCTSHFMPPCPTMLYANLLPLLSDTFTAPHTRLHRSAFSWPSAVYHPDLTSTFVTASASSCANTFTMPSSPTSPFGVELWI